MATNIEQIFRDFVMNKIKEIADESQENSRTDDTHCNTVEPQSEPVTETREDGLPTEQINTTTDKVTHTNLQDGHGKEDTSTKHRKSKKHKKHKSKKKKKKNKAGKETVSDRETQESGKKKKKKKKSREADKVKRSGSCSESSSASGSEFESQSKPSRENTKSSSAGKASKSELKETSGFDKSQELPDIISKMENHVHNNIEYERAKDKKQSSSRTSKREENCRGRRTRSRSPKRKSKHRSRSRSQSSKRLQKSKSRSHSRNSPRKSSLHRERSRSRSKRRNKRSRSRSARRGRNSRSKSHSRRTRSRSVVILRQNRRSASKSRSHSPRCRNRSRSRSQGRTKHSKSRSLSKSRSISKDRQKKTETINNDTVPAKDNCLSSGMQQNVSQKTTENGQSPQMAVNTEARPPEIVVDGSNSVLNAVGVIGSWRPVPFSSQFTESNASQKCITLEVPLEAISTVEPKDPECTVNPEKEETTTISTTDTQTSIENNSVSPSKSPNSQRSKRAARSRSKSSSKRRKSRSSSWNKSKSRSPSRRKSSKSKLQNKLSKSRSPKRKRSRSPGKKRSKTPERSRRSRSRRKSRSHSRRRSQSGSSWRRGFGSRSLNQRDRWKREPSRSPVLILRKKRLTSKTRRSSSKTPPRLTELDKEQLLEIAKANAAAMCAKAGVPIPESLRPKAAAMSLPLGIQVMSNMTMNAALASMTAATMTAALSSMGALASLPQFAPLPTIVNKPPPSTTPNLASIEEAKRRVTKQANSFSIQELTERCKKITESKEEMAIAKPHMSDDEDDEKTFGGTSLKENKGIAFSLSSTSVKPAVRTEAVFAKEFPVSSGSQHRKKEADGAYGEWVPVEKKTEKPSASGSAETEESSKDNDSVFPEAPSQPVDITLAVSERAVAQKRLAENPFDINAMCMLNRAQEQVDAWAQSNTIPGLFTGSTGAQVLSSDELSNSGPQAWIKKDQFLRAAPVSGGMGELLMRKMGWRSGEGLGKHREGTVDPIVIDFKTDRKGLVAEGEKTQKSGNIVVMKDLLGGREWMRLPAPNCQS
ncbi:protein SON-like isoform X2 [Xyrauchen texanus]|uniref:protein SON-like isoform X2 n=1 Tax=Xyrauchen texanus TaxID=154827 RepID=UPI002242846A|nr:protein SON-like isoform X2 [Xyrauchen texanus]